MKNSLRTRVSRIGLGSFVNTNFLSRDIVLFSFFTFAFFFISLKSKPTQMLRRQKGNSGISFNDTILNFELPTPIFPDTITTNIYLIIPAEFLCTPWWPGLPCCVEEEVEPWEKIFHRQQLGFQTHLETTILFAGLQSGGRAQWGISRVQGGWLVSVTIFLLKCINLMMRRDNLNAFW